MGKKPKKPLKTSEKILIVKIHYENPKFKFTHNLNF